MTILDIIAMAGGLAMFLFGMSTMGDSLAKMAGGKLEKILEKFTSKRIFAVLLGAGVTAVIQSSSATTVMVVGFVNSGIMNLNQAVGIIIGANIGTTVTSWILSLIGLQGDSLLLSLLKPAALSSICAFIGILLYMNKKDKGKSRDTGMILLGFAVLMFGMQTMSNAVAPLADDPNVQTEYQELIPFVTKIRNQHAEILEAAKSRQDFTANVSHELKTPLTSILGYSEIIETDKDSSSQQKHFASQIHKNANRLLSLINDTIRLSELDYSGGSIQMDNIDLNELASNCVNGIKINAEAQDITLNYQGEKAMVKGNARLLNEVIENLVDNAIRYNKKDGTVNVSVKNDSNKVILTVEDNGIGIPEKDQQHVFERFYRVDKSRSKATGGTGLGLAIVKHISELHDAEINLSSSPSGTTITIAFKALEKPSA